MLIGWRNAMETALYGQSGFFVAAAPAEHFRTSVHATPLFAGALLSLIDRIDVALGRPDHFEVVARPASAIVTARNAMTARRRNCIASA